MAVLYQCLSGDRHRALTGALNFLNSHGPDGARLRARRGALASCYLRSIVSHLHWASLIGAASAVTAAVIGGTGVPSRWLLFQRVER